MGDNGPGFQIDTAGVKDFGAQLKSDVDKDIAPTTERIKQNLTWYPSFGARSVSPVVQAVATTYNDQLNRALAFMDVLIHNAGALAQAAQVVVTAYQNSDELSTATMQQILGSAATTVDAAKRELEQEQARADREDLLNERKFMHQHGAH